MKMKDRFMCRVCGQTPCNCTSVSEAIKGWKHAHSDLMKMRASQGKDVVLHSLKKDGKESGMHDARKSFKDEDEAHEYHERVTKLNPTKQIRHNLYVDGKLVKTLGEEMNLDEAVHSPYRNAAIALRNMSFDPKNSASDRAAYGTHADLLHSKDPKDHETSARLAQRHDTAVRDEISNAIHHNSSKVNSAKYHKMAGWTRLKEESRPMKESTMSPMEMYLAAIAGNADFASTLAEKTLTPAEKKKREEIAQAIERENPGMAMSKKMAIATATAKKVAEGVEQIDELKKSTLQSYAGKAGAEAGAQAKVAGTSDDDGKNLGEEEKHIKLADVKMALKNVKNASSHTKKLIKANPTQKLPHGMSCHAAYSEEFELDEGQTVKTKTGEDTFEYAKVDKEGNRTGDRHYRNAKGEVMGEARIGANTLRRAGQKAIAAMKQAAKDREGTEPKSDREHDLASAAKPYDKITHKDVLVKRGVVKEEELDEAKDFSQMSDADLRKHINIRIRNAMAANLSKEASESLRQAQAEMKKRRQKRIAEEMELDEAVEISHDRYLRSHGKKARDVGNTRWMFTSKRMGDVDHKNDKEFHQAPYGSFADAKKSAKAWAKQHGHSTAYVMEEVDLDEAVSPEDKETMQARAVQGRERINATKQAMRAMPKSVSGGARGEKNVEQGFRSAIKRAYKKADVAEDVDLEEEQLDELKSSTLKSYADKRMALFSRTKGIVPGSKEHQQWKMAQKAYDKAAAKRMVPSMAREEVELEEEIIVEAKHRVSVTVSEPDHPAVSMRKTTKQKTIRVSADDKVSAVARAKAHYKKQGYKVHDAEHVGMVGEETELGEAMISYSDFMDKIAMHRKMGNKVVDHKYTDKKATYTTVDSEGVGKKITHTETGTKQEHLGKIEGKDDEAEVKQPEKRGRGRPAGTKSGARH